MRWLPLLLLVPATASANERHFSVTSFDSIRVQGPFTVTVTGGDTPDARAEGSLNDLDRVTVRVEDDVLIISGNPGAWGAAAGSGEIRVKVTAPALRGAWVSGGAKLTLDRVTGDRVLLNAQGLGSLDAHGIAAGDLNVTASGVSAIKLEGHADQARLRALGQVDLDASALAATRLALFNESGGTVQAQASEQAVIANFGPGGVTVTGAAPCQVSGKAPVDCAGGIKPR